MDRACRIVRGAVAIATGAATLSAGIAAGLLPVVLVGGAVTGTGAGAVFTGAVALALDHAAPDARGGTLATLFVAGYLGLTVPILGLGALAEATSLQAAALVFGATLTTSAITFGAISHRLQRPPDTAVDPLTSRR